EATIAHLGETARDGNALRLGIGRAIDGDIAVSQSGHVGCMAGHDAGLAFGARNHDHTNLVRHDQPVGSHKLEMQIGHYSLPSIFSSKARVAASNLSRHPVLQKPTTLPR